MHAVIIGRKIDLIDLLILVVCLDIVPYGALDDLHDPVIEARIEDEELFLERIVGTDDAFPIAVEGIPPV